MRLPLHFALLPLLASSPAVDADTLAERVAPPLGYERIDAPGSNFAAWLRELPLRPERPDVRLFDGSLKRNQAAHHAVFDLDVGSRDLQQCADAVIRLRAEYLFRRLWEDGCDDIAFHFTNGDVARWLDWRQGIRPRVSGNEVTWHRSAPPDDSYANFRRYLDTVFTYAGTHSLARELDPVPDPSRVEAGDVFIQGGFPGHAVIVVDVAEDAHGRRAFLLAQSYMPAQDIHLLRNPGKASPWYEAKSAGALQTPEWLFDVSDLHRFPKSLCAP